MFWLIFWTANLVSGSDCRESIFPSPSVSDAMRLGATFAARLVNSGTPDFFLPFLRKLSDRMSIALKINPKEKEKENLFSNVRLVLDLLGVDPKKVNELAFEGIITFLRMFSQVLTEGEEGRREGRMSRKFSLFRFILNQPQVVDLLVQMQNPDLVDLILEESRDKLKDFPPENVECLQLLTCKTKPFVKGMQTSLRFFMKREKMKISGEDGVCQKESCDEDGDWEKADLEDRMYFFAPTLEEVIQCGDRCDHLFPNCIY